MRKENNTIEITEDVRIPGTDVILEVGDKIEVLKEAMSGIGAVDAQKLMLDVHSMMRSASPDHIASALELMPPNEKKALAQCAFRISEFLMDI